jgi:hypothetical protein
LDVRNTVARVEHALSIMIFIMLIAKRVRLFISSMASCSQTNRQTSIPFGSLWFYPNLAVVEDISRELFPRFWSF